MASGGGLQVLARLFRATDCSTASTAALRATPVPHQGAPTGLNNLGIQGWPGTCPRHSTQCGITSALALLQRTWLPGGAPMSLQMPSTRRVFWIFPLAPIGRQQFPKWDSRSWRLPGRDIFHACPIWIIYTVTPAYDEYLWWIQLITSRCRIYKVSCYQHLLSSPFPRSRQSGNGCTNSCPALRPNLSSPPRGQLPFKYSQALTSRAPVPSPDSFYSAMRSLIR